ncbi:MAG: glycosyltransferase, partial [Nonlabens sp.]
KSLADHHAKVKFFQNPQNVGLVQNWKNSIEKSTGTWIKFLFQDDLMHSTTISTMMKHGLANGVETVLCDRAYFYEADFDPDRKKFYDKKLIKTQDLFPELRSYAPIESAQRIATFYFKNCLGEPPCYLFKKSSFTVEDMPGEFKQLIDYVFILRRLLKADFVFIPEKLVQFRVHNTSESMRNNKLDVQDSKVFNNFIYVQYYERLMLAHNLEHNTLFQPLKQQIPARHIEIMKNFFMLASYKKYGFDQVFQFYKNSGLSSYLINQTTSSYSYLRYKMYKLKHAKVINIYK